MTTKTYSSVATHGRFVEDGYPTLTSHQQIKVEKSVAEFYLKFLDELNEKNDIEVFKLLRSSHVLYLKRGLIEPLSSHFECLDSSRPWLVYWISNSLSILGHHNFLRENDFKIVSFLKHCECPVKGGYSGSPGQQPHLAATYAAVNALVTVGGDIALASINRDSIRKFICDMEQPDGSFSLHETGEIDIRGVYCALSVAKLVNIPIFSDTNNELSKDGLFSKTVDWLLSCQTYEGGFGAAPGHEAHGGYTFCGVASLVLLNQLHRCDIEALLNWVTNKQLKYEGGFSGRTNKLVDGCYSFWNGAIVPIIQAWLTKQENQQFDRWLINQESLQWYILLCCQEKSGGLVDKPGKPRDFYHTCYTLAGLSIAQYSMNSQLIMGHQDNSVEQIHPIFNVHLDAIKECKEFFSK